MSDGKGRSYGNEAVQDVMAIRGGESRIAVRGLEAGMTSLFECGRGVIAVWGRGKVFWPEMLVNSACS